MTQRDSSPQVIDTLLEVETPEGVDLQADLAGPVPRGMAFIVDCCIRILVMLIVAWIALLVGEMGMGLWLIALFLMEWWYPVFFEIYRNGQTPGKKIYNLQVVNQDLTPVSFGTSIVRNFLRPIDFLPAFYTFGLISTVCTKRFQRLGDLAAGTVVIQKPSTSILPTTKVTNDDSDNEAETSPPPLPLSEWEQDAMIEFTQRQDSLSQARQQEMADILSPVTGRSGEEAVSYLRSVGNWLLGKS